MKFLRLCTRMLAIAAILLMMVFSLDVFTGDEPVIKKLLGFMVHNIPSFIMIIFLVIAWKHEVIGGVLFILSFLALAIFFGSFGKNPASLTVISPLLLVGISFIISGLLKKRSDALT